MRTLIALAATLAACPPLFAELHFPQPTVKRGEAKRGAALRQKFPFVNRGPAAVAIRAADASCGCVAPVLDKRIFKPGESGELGIEVNTLTQPAGPNRWRIVVEYLDGETPRRVELALLADLVAEIAVVPPKLAVSTEGALAHEFKVEDRRAKPLRIVAARTSSAHLHASLAADGVRLDILETLPPGSHEEILCIYTSDPEYRELRVPVSVRKRAAGAVVASPASVSLELPRGQAAPSRLVRLRGAEAVEVEKIETDHPALSCRWAAGPGAQATLRISVDGAKVSDVLHGNVRVTLKRSAEVVSIPVSATVR